MAISTIIHTFVKGSSTVTTSFGKKNYPKTSGVAFVKSDDVATEKLVFETTIIGTSDTVTVNGNRCLIRVAPDAYLTTWDLRVHGKVTKSMSDFQYRFDERTSGVGRALFYVNTQFTDEISVELTTISAGTIKVYILEVGNNDA